MNRVAEDALAGRDVAHLIHPLTRHRQLEEIGPVIVVEGRGAEIVLDDGRVLVDGSAGLWNVNLGHGRRSLIEAATAQMEKLAFSPTFGGVLRTARRSAWPSSLPTWRPATSRPCSSPPAAPRPTSPPSSSPALLEALQGKPSKSIVIVHDRGYHGLSPA